MAHAADDGEPLGDEESDETVVVGYLPLVFVHAVDAGVSSEWKCWEHVDCNVVLWEFRRIFFNIHKKTAELHSYLVKQWGAYANLFGRFNLDVNRHILMSRRQCKCRAIAPTVFHKNEAAVTTLALLVLLAHWCSTSRCKLARAMVSGMLISWLATFIEWIKVDILAEFGIIDEDDAAKCQEDVDANSFLCCHCCVVFRPPGDLSLKAHVAPVLVEAVAASDRCLVLQAWCSTTLPWLAELLDRALDCVQLKRDPLKSTLVMGPQKKRRLDEDFVKALVFATQEKGRAGCGENWARATGDLTPTIAKKRGDQQMFMYNTASWCSFKDAKYVMTIFDASRFGNPRKDILQIFAENLETHMAVVCPPTVLRDSCVLGAHGGPYCSTGAHIAIMWAHIVPWGPYISLNWIYGCPYCPIGAHIAPWGPIWPHGPSETTCNIGLSLGAHIVPWAYGRPSLSPSWPKIVPWEAQVWALRGPSLGLSWA